MLVLGAGASFGARREEPRPPLGKQLASYLLGWFDANAPQDGDYEWAHAMEYELDGTAPPDRLYDGDPDVRPILERAVERSRSSDTGFEDVMDEVMREPSGSRAGLERLNEVLAISLLGGRACAFERKTDLYDELFSLLCPRLRSIITPNYDVLAEEALERIGLTYRYGGTRYADMQYGIPQESGEADVVLYKFHGSANWFQVSGTGGKAQMAKPLRAVPQTRIPSFYNDQALYPARPRENAFLEHKREGMPPIMVTYGPGKDALHGRPYLDAVREACAADLAKPEPRRIISLGISPPRGQGDDEAWEQLCKVFSALGSAKEYWSGALNERAAMVAHGFEPRAGWFDDLLAALRTATSA